MGQPRAMFEFDTHPLRAQFIDVGLAFIEQWIEPVSYTHLTLPTSDLV